jgi:transcriptional regulator with XRE-family HTH domain
MTGQLVDTLADRIRWARLRRGWSQVQLSSRVGAAQSLVSAWETAQRRPNIEQLEHLSRTLDVPILLLLEGTARLPVDTATLAAELRWYGLDVVDAREAPLWAVRGPEELLAAALRDPDPRIVDQLPGLLLVRDDLSGILAIAHARDKGVERRLGWIADVARALHRLGLGRWTRALDEFDLEPRAQDRWDSLGHPAARREDLGPAWKRWKVDYDRDIAGFAKSVLPVIEGGGPR